jgi:hypothetical protein
VCVAEEPPKESFIGLSDDWACWVYWSHTCCCSLSGGPIGPRAGAVARPDPMSCAAPPHCAPPHCVAPTHCVAPRCAAHPGTTNSRFR